MANRKPHLTLERNNHGEVFIGLTEFDGDTAVRSCVLSGPQYNNIPAESVMRNRFTTLSRLIDCTNESLLDFETTDAKIERVAKAIEEMYDHWETHGGPSPAVADEARVAAAVLGVDPVTDEETLDAIYVIRCDGAEHTELATAHVAAIEDRDAGIRAVATLSPEASVEVADGAETFDSDDNDPDLLKLSVVAVHLSDTNAFRGTVLIGMHEVFTFFDDAEDYPAGIEDFAGVTVRRFAKRLAALLDPTD